ncbi:MAG: hypothetical protein VX512_09935 [Pseudomonadota bacterium]|uniref:hypothetical protein n=1 Tax=Qipengyuania pacifica TaxID=2860199 RepID=UPI002E8A5D50|nr:hypothetical protein [Erythrobacter sp.]MEE2795145.1 hypothetical protein [Pseudomonadota bacterium]
MGQDNRKHPDEGGAKERHSGNEQSDKNPVLKEEDRQALKNQSKADPEDYPDRGIKPA